ncbi:MAG: zf-HC2 domain-containing protein, partial [Firmicutes bacterium]|nr:zf-HC2 domain-containing protein [Bacillota bacterium]
MACRPEMLSAYIDGQLEPAARRRVEAHVRRCLRCRAELDELVALKRLLEAAPVPSPPAGLTESIVGRVRFREARRQRFRHRWRFWQGAAAGAAVA